MRYETTYNKSEIFYSLTVNFFLVSLDFSDHGLLNDEFFVLYCYTHLASKETKKQKLVRIKSEVFIATTRLS